MSEMLLPVEPPSTAAPVVVTGAAGFIGRSLCGRLAERGYLVRGVDLTPGEGPWHELLVGDVTEAAGHWTDALGGASTVFHLAGKVHSLAEVRQDEEEYFRINTGGTRNLLEAAARAGVRRFVLMSTVKAMSRDDAPNPVEHGGPRPWTERDEVEPDTPYGRSKLEAERLVLQGGFVPEPVVLRLCMVYGAAAKGNIRSMLQAVDRHRFPPLPEFGNHRSMVHVADVVQAALLAGESGAAAGQVLIVSDGRAYSTREIYELMCRALRRRSPSWTVPTGFLRILGVLGDLLGRSLGRRVAFDSGALSKLTGSAWFSSAKIEGLLGFRPRHDLEQALPEMIDELRLRVRTTGLGGNRGASGR